MEDIDVYFTVLEKAYNAIKTDGFKTQAELSEEEPGSVRGFDDEILLYVDRNGGLILGHGGTHRLLICKLLQLERVPGLVKGVHKEWARRHFTDGSLRDSLQSALSASFRVV